jgi:hypothetical protein
MMSAVRYVLFALLIGALPVMASAEGPVATVVTVKTPPGVTRAMIEGGFRQAVPVYQKVPGLIRKYFTVNDEVFGGMYLWKDRAAAEAWFNAQWRAKARATYGSEPTVTYFDAPVQIENSTVK